MELAKPVGTARNLGLILRSAKTAITVSVITALINALSVSMDKSSLKVIFAKLLEIIKFGKYKLHLYLIF